MSQDEIFQDYTPWAAGKQVKEIRRWGMGKNQALMFIFTDGSRFAMTFFGEVQDIVLTDQFSAIIHRDPSLGGNPYPDHNRSK